MQNYLDIDALGTVVRVPLPTDSSDASRSLVARAKAAWRDAIFVGDSVDIPTTEVSLSQTQDADRALENLSIQVTLAALEQQAGKLMMLHAGGIALDDGRVIAFAAPSGHGKTTLTTALSRKYGYVSDETIAFDENMHVYPYRKPLSVVSSTGPKQQFASSVLGLEPLPDPQLRLAAVVLLDRIGAAGTEHSCRPQDTTQAPPNARRLTLVEALTYIVAHTSYLTQLDRPLQRLAEAVGAIGGFLVLRYRESVDVTDYLPTLLGLADRRESWQPIDIETVADLEVHDALQLGTGEVIVLVDSQLHVLGGVGAEVWRRMLGGEGTEEIESALVSQFGAPPDGSPADASEYVARAIAELRAAGLVHSQ